MTPDIFQLRRALAAYERPKLASSLFQLGSTLMLFIGACALMYWSLRIGYAVTIALSLPAGALLVRIFIFQHDCGHGSFFRSRRLNDWTGTICGVLTLTPYANWRRQHAGHHTVWNNLGRRQSGADIYSSCMTVAEYRSLSPLLRRLHRCLRHPVVAHLLIPPLVFILLYRVPFDTPRHWMAERRAVYLNNALIAAVVAGLASAVGVVPVLMVQLPVMSVAAIVGVWLFAIQHRFDGARWCDDADWQFSEAALQGSSYLKLPKVLQWCTGNIGFHHIHHLAPAIPNYRLEACQSELCDLLGATPLGLRAALASIGFCLWDEERCRLVRFSDISAPSAA